MKIILTTIFLALSSFSFSQANFQWDVVFDSLNLSEETIYNRTKVFFSDFWKDVPYTIEIDEKRGGLLLARSSIKESFEGWGRNEYTFEYSFQINIKKDRVRAQIYNVACVKAIKSSKYQVKPPVQNFYPPENGLIITGLDERTYTIMMMNLIKDLNQVALSYRTALKSQEDEW